MKSKIILMTAISLLIAIAFTINAQQKPRNQKESKKPLQEVKSFTGEVTGWANNDDFVYNGFFLQTNSTKFLVKFPPHMGSALTTAIKTGSTISVNGVEGLDTLAGIKEIRLVSVIADGKTLNETTPVAPATIPAKELINGNGKISELQKNKDGKVKGFILDNKTILRVPPNVAEQLNTVAVVGAAISYSGEKQILHTGEVAADSYTIIHCKTITFNGKQYLTK